MPFCFPNLEFQNISGCFAMFLWHSLKKGWSSKLKSLMSWIKMKPYESGTIPFFNQSQPHWSVTVTRFSYADDFRVYRLQDSTNYVLYVLKQLWTALLLDIFLNNIDKTNNVMTFMVCKMGLVLRNCHLNYMPQRISYVLEIICDTEYDSYSFIYGRE